MPFDRCFAVLTLIRICIRIRRAQSRAHTRTRPGSTPTLTATAMPARPHRRRDRIGQYWTGGSNPKLNAGRDRIDRRTYSNPLIELISPSVIPGSNHLCRFSILIPFSFPHWSPPFLLAHSRAQLIDPRTLIILASARCCFGPAARSASAHSAQQSRCTQLAAQSALSFHPPSTPSSLSFLAPSFTLASLSLLARASRCSPRRSLSNLFAFASVWSKGP